MNNDNPSISPLLRLVTTIECLVLAGAGIGLFFFYDFMATQWPWVLTPFNSGFLGAIYLASMVATGLLLAMPNWTPGRMLLPMILTFTLVMLVASLIHIGQFDFQRISTWLWFALYIVLPINALYHMWLYRKLPPANAVLTPTLLRAYLGTQAVIMALYGFALILAPTAVTGFWPWKINDFHAHLYSALAFTGAIPVLVLARKCSIEECFTLGMTQIALGLLAIVGVVLRSAKVDYSAAGTWLWLAAFAISALSGIAMVVYARRLMAKAAA